ILEGVTRDSVIRGLAEMGIRTEERKISIDEVVDAYGAGKISEVFGTGTAAVIAPIRELYYKGASMHFNTDKYEISRAVKTWLNEIRSGERADKYNWMVKV
ncbi:MAG: branched chain amino acid aminotransferase, partial [Chitinophagaceae bacterium]